MQAEEDRVQAGENPEVVPEVVLQISGDSGRPRGEVSGLDRTCVLSDRLVTTEVCRVTICNSSSFNLSVTQCPLPKKGRSFPLVSRETLRYRTRVDRTLRGTLRVLLDGIPISLGVK